PCVGKSLIVSSYTHPEYAISILPPLHSPRPTPCCCGTEGEAVANPRHAHAHDAGLCERPDHDLAGAPGQPADQPAQPAHRNWTQPPPQPIFKV
ncbi:MAG: hypothetical protein IPN04_10675, partial [Rhodoferax sp.]|nr:hypothetical protein [Rhodoferax sp.]